MLSIKFIFFIRTKGEDGSQNAEKIKKKIIFPAAVLWKIPTFIYFIHLSLLLSNSFNVFSPHDSQYSSLFQLGSVFSSPSSKSHQFAASPGWCSSESIILSWRNCLWQAGAPTEPKTPTGWCAFLWAHSTSHTGGEV